MGTIKGLLSNISVALKYVIDVLNKSSSQVKICSWFTYVCDRPKSISHIFINRNQSIILI
jgi:hypothetical protein